MENLPARIPKSAVFDLNKIFIPIDAPDDSYIELSIRIDDKDVSLRDLGAFLELVHRIYGRLSEKGLKSYAHKEHGHLKVQEMRRGSWELILQEAIASGYSHALILAYLAVKYLPSAIESLANSYNQVEQGRLAKQQRKRIRVEMEQDEAISKLSKKRRYQIADLVDYLHEKEKERLHRAVRFARQRLLSVSIKIRSKDE